MLRNVIAVALGAQLICGCAHSTGTGLKPTETGDVIGTATMLSDRKIVMTLSSVDCEGAVVHMEDTTAPGDPGYADLVAHLGGVSPGQTKPVHAWPAEPCEKTP